MAEPAAAVAAAASEAKAVEAELLEAEGDGSAPASTAGAGNNKKKKNNKKQKAKAKDGADEDDDEPPEMLTDPEAAASLGAAVLPTPTTNGKPIDVVKYIQQSHAQQIMQRTAKLTTEPKEHKFWDTQPVPKLDAEVSENGPIEEKDVADVRAEPYNMPAGFEWCVLDMKSETQADEVYHLLNENYVEDDDNLFRFDYSKPFLQWALTPPGYSEQFHLGVRGSKTGKLLGFISGVPATMRVLDKTVKTVEINFLCVHKKLRSKRLAPVLIKEVTRRVNRSGVWQMFSSSSVSAAVDAAVNKRCVTH
eukprot:15896-Heterococcus_DN1.PRE.4